MKNTTTEARTGLLIAINDARMDMHRGNARDLLEQLAAHADRIGHTATAGELRGLQAMTDHREILGALRLVALDLRDQLTTRPSLLEVSGGAEHIALVVSQ